MENLSSNAFSDLENGGITVSPLLSNYDFEASSFFDGYMLMSVMAGRIESDLNFEKKCKKLAQGRDRKEKKNA